MFTKSAKNISLQTQKKFIPEPFGVSTTFGLNSLSENKATRKKHFYTRGHESACIVIITFFAFLDWK